MTRFPTTPVCVSLLGNCYPCSVPDSHINLETLSPCTSSPRTFKRRPKRSRAPRLSLRSAILHPLDFGPG